MCSMFTVSDSVHTKLCYPFFTVWLELGGFSSSESRAVDVSSLD